MKKEKRMWLGGLTEVHLQPDSNELYKSTFSLENGDDHESGGGGGGSSSQRDKSSVMKN